MPRQAAGCARGLCPANLSDMPERATIERPRRGGRAVRSPSTVAGEFVREEIHHIRKRVHGARSAKQAIAIGLSKARRAGVRLPPPRKGRTSESVRRRAVQDFRAGQHPHRVSRRRSQATFRALRREGRAAASHTALSRQARKSARRRSAASRTAAAKQAARTRANGSREAAQRTDGHEAV